MLSWYLIHTKPHGECVAQANLERQGYEVYFPKVLQPVRRRGLWRERIAALFPRYLFLRLQEGLQALRPVHSSAGVTCVVRFGIRYAVVADQIIHDLRARADPGCGLHRLYLPAQLECGSDVTVLGGPFDGLEGIFDRDEGEDRAVVLLRLLGQDVRASIPACFITSTWSAKSSVHVGR